MNEAVGKVYLVGAGPGDPGLITVRGREVLERANVVVYDSLVNDALLRHAPQAEVIFVGKRPNRHALPQEDIHRVLVEQARRVACVVRLKGGDPFVFGRGGEEAQALAAQGIPFEVVPGVTAGVAAPAYAGIPVTHRGMAASVTFITGHLDPSKDIRSVALDKLHLEGTLVFYMARKNLAAITANLMAMGRPAQTPAAVIQWGTSSRQRTVTGTLGNIPELCTAEGIESPVVVVVGEVAGLRKELAWFENRPLYGRRVAVTESRKGAGELHRLLRERGADVFEFPTLEIDAIDDPDPFDGVAQFDWIILTSRNAVDALFERMKDHGLDARDLHGVRLCAVGAGTVDAVADRFLRVDLQPDRPDATTVLNSLKEACGAIEGQKFLLPRSDIAPSALPRALRDHGASVTELRAYRTAVPQDADTLAAALVAYDPHYVTFTSAAAARNFHSILGADGVARISRGTIFAAMGPIATAAAAELAMNVQIEPEAHRTSTLVEAIVAWDASPRKT